MGWLGDAFSWVGGVIVDGIEWCTDKIQDAVAWFRYVKYELKKAIADWLSNDLGILAALGILILSILLLPKLIDKIKSSSALDFIMNVVDDSASWFAAIGGDVALMSLDAANAILATFWDEYRDVLNDFNAVMGMLADEFGEGTGFIHSYMALGHAAHLQTGVILGLDESTTETAWFEDANAFWKRLDDKFQHYARYPEEILGDIIDLIVIPATERSRAGMNGFREWVYSAHERTTEIQGALTTLQYEVNSFIASLDPMIQDAILSYWSPINDWISEKMAAWDEYIMDTFDAVNDQLIRQGTRIDTINALAVKRGQAVEQYLAELYALPDDLRIKYLNILDQIAQSALKEKRTELDTQASACGDSVSSLFISRIKNTRAPVFLTLEPSGAYSLPAVERKSLPSWFCGEY